MERDPYERLENLLPESDELGIDGYETIDPIGEGGFGRVFRARQIAFARDVAIKVLAASGMKDETVRRFERECRAVGTLSGHPHIVTIYDSGISRWGRPYIVMDHMSGGSFADVLNRSGPLTQETAVDAIIKIAGAVETAHRAGILHRDIKPENILLSAYGEPVLADFGVASIPGGYQTHTGAITASLAHAAPEVLEGHKATRAVDVYALGSTLFALIAGHPAFSPSEDGGLQSLIARTLTHPVPDLRTEGVPDEVCKIIEKAMAKDPEQRFDSVEALGEALQSAQLTAGSPVTEMPLERAAIVAYPSEPVLSPESSRTQLRERRELTPPQPSPAPKRVVWRSPVFAAAMVLLLAVGSVIALRARDRRLPPPATSPQGQATDLVAEPDDDGAAIEREARDNRRKKGRERGPQKKPASRDGGNLSLAGPSSGGYSPPLSGGAGGGGDSYAPPSGGAGGSTGSTGSGGSGGGSGQPKPPPEPVGSEKLSDITFYHHWDDDGGAYFFTANFSESQDALGDYDHRVAIGEVWSRRSPGDDLTPLCPTPDRCYGHVADRPPRSGNYLTLYWHPGGEHGRFFSTDRSATYRGEAMSVYGYIRPA